ncbi:hypothetical protein OKW33_006356 [Paraburkholderia atlantica]|uniref:Uncharacterized protein n=1 Tax=Paraburkholderia atlantica TaxID=2654982 RepID=A0A7W8QHN0_PARAM|nr:hypothetical protein [Paraburkholderia atlantica]
MEHLVRVYNEKDRQTLEWLRRHVGDAAIATAVEQCAGSGKPYLSTVCRRLGVRTPEFSVARRRVFSDCGKVPSYHPKYPRCSTGTRKTGC